MIYLFTLAGGAFSFVLATWVMEKIALAGEKEMLLSLDERLAVERYNALREEFADRGLPQMKRREIWRRIAWIWHFTRLVALRSARLGAVAWLAFFGLACLGLILKTALFPRSRDLRFLIGGNELITFYAG